jgi:murein DD-endopeptidase MepM/ murein hydrolase activator NlpD
MTFRRHGMSLCAVVLAASAVCASFAIADAPPWRARRRSFVISQERMGTKIDVAEWPVEPPAPAFATIDRPRFARAIRELCQGGPPGRFERYADWIVDAAQEVGEDPFLIGALIWREGRCQPDREDERGVGMTRIPREMYAGNWRRGVLSYQVRPSASARWEKRTRPMDRHNFAGPALKRADASIYYTAGLLAMWREQHAAVDGAFEQVPHRHYVSHWIWGDRVRNPRNEDRLLTDRRRLLFYYGAIGPMPPLEREGVVFGSPLDGAPRVVTSALGVERDGGERRHRGIDIESMPNEPVRAVADGRVTFAGVDLPGREHRQMRPQDYEGVPRDQLGNGGRYACISHPRAGGGTITSCYMHMETVEVVAGQQVQRGDRIGTVGRTGMQDSAAHLHFELKTARQVYNPLELLHGLVLGIPPPV